MADTNTEEKKGPSKKELKKLTKRQRKTLQKLLSKEPREAEDKAEKVHLPTTKVVEELKLKLRSLLHQRID